ncbi:MAG: hypothetical protein ABI481_01575 [Pyrinomonadaceae bacterium]
MEIESIASDDGSVFKGNVFGDLGIIERFLARPLVYTSRARTRTPELVSRVMGLRVIGPFDRDRGVILFPDLNGF